MEGKEKTIVKKPNINNFKRHANIASVDLVGMRFYARRRLLHS